MPDGPQNATRRQIAGDASTPLREAASNQQRNRNRRADGLAQKALTGPVVDGQSYSKRAHLAETADAYCRISRHLAECAVGVPHIYSADEGEGFVLLEDLGTRTLEVMAHENDDDLPAFYLEAVETLIHLHEMGAPDFLRAYDSDVWRLKPACFWTGICPIVALKLPSQLASSGWICCARWHGSAIARRRYACCAIFIASTCCGSRTSRGVTASA